MATNISSINDYSYLFTNLTGTKAKSSSSNDSSIFNFSLSDYAGIKNGSFYKLTKAYYAKNNGSSNSTSTSNDNTQKLTAIKTDAKQLAKSADALITTGSKSLFNKEDIVTTNSNEIATATKDYDMDSILKGVSSFIDDYNSLIESGAESDTNSILRNTLSMTTLTNSHSNILAKVGITINSDNTLSIDKESFKAADVSTMKSLFNGSGSYAYSIGAYASQIGYYADAEANKVKTYTESGTYENNYSSGELYDSYL